MTLPLPSYRRAVRQRAAVALAALALAVLALSGCTATGQASTSPTTAAQELLAAHGLDGLDTRQVIERLDTMAVADRPSDLLASVEPADLVLRDDRGRESRLPMPDDEVYISVAPFRDQTHECHFHSLTTCLGELVDTEVRLIVTTDYAEVLIDETRRTYDNGFVGIWVPRGVNATLTVESDGLRGSAPLSTTSPDDPTCVTGVRLL